MSKIRDLLKSLPFRLKEKSPLHGWKQWLVSMLFLFVLAGILVIVLRVETSYRVLEAFEKTDVAGTKYLTFGNKLLKYSPDGVSCVNGNGETVWNSTFSIQSPIVDICGTTAVVGDQQGTQVYIFNEEGRLGAFETLLPIQKIKVARQGVVAAILEDGDVTWINFYNTNGDEIAKMRTTLKESGYPLDMALSPDGMKIMVSYLHADQGAMETRVAFYNFDAVGQAEENNQVSLYTYDSTVIPLAFFVDEKHAAALRSDGFSIYEGSQVPKEKVNVQFDEEILSSFHENGRLGFIFKSDKNDYKYVLKVYNLNGRCSMKKYFNMDYRGAKLSEDNIILYNEKEFQVFSSRGRKKAEVTYKKAIENVVGVPGIGKYMVMSSGSTEVIRVK